MSTVSFPIRHPDSWADQTMLEMLEVFDLPLILYGAGCRLVGVSPVAQRMLASLPESAAALSSISSAVRQTLFCAPDREGEPGSLPSCEPLAALGDGGSITIHRPRRAIGDVEAIAVLRLGTEPAEFMGHVLTPREQEVAYLIASGAANKEVAARLGISCHTARHHTERVYGKLRVKNRVSLARLIVNRAS